MASRSNGAGEDRNWDELRMNRNNAQAGGYFSCKERDGEAEGFSPLYSEKTEQSCAGANAGKEVLEFVWRTMLSTQVQDVVAKVDLVGQNLMVATNGNKLRNLRRRLRALKTTLAWGMDCLDHIGQR
jgi:hypothetical protein